MTPISERRHDQARYHSSEHPPWRTLRALCGGEAWNDAAAALSAEIGLPIRVHLIGLRRSDARCSMKDLSSEEGYFTEETSAAVVASRSANAKDARLAEVVSTLVKYLHAAV